VFVLGLIHSMASIAVARVSVWGVGRAV